MTEMRRLLDLMDATDPVTEPTLAEGRYNGTALLYHSSDPSNALLIISSGNIEPRTTATIDGHKVDGVSLTRSRWFAIVYNSVIFGFDEQKIRRCYRGKLVPYVDSNLDAGHIVGMLDARFPPCSDFDGVSQTRHAYRATAISPRVEPRCVGSIR